MIERRTVLILGAGASAPYGFPLGRGLLTTICEELSGRGRTQMRQDFLDFGFSELLVDEFCEALQKSGRESVDAFLEHQNNQDIEHLGKSAMAYVLIRHETEESLFRDVKPEEDWYKYLNSRLNTEFEDLGKNQITILTYNYDRSLEHFLFTSFRHSYAKPHRDCAERVMELGIIHLHGKLGDLPYFGDPSRAYKGHINKDVMRTSVPGIRVVHEDITVNPAFGKAQRALNDAELICFLGFGYDPTNLERLGVLDLDNGAEIIGTAKDLSSRECELIAGRFKMNVELTNDDLAEVRTFLHEEAPFG